MSAHSALINPLLSKVSMLQERHMDHSAHSALINPLFSTQSPRYKNFTGTIVHTEPCRHAVYGHIARLSPTSVEVTELPIRTWTQSYKENVLEAMLHGSEKVQPSITWVGGGDGVNASHVKGLIWGDGVNASHKLNACEPHHEYP